MDIGKGRPGSVLFVNHPDAAIADDWITHYFALPAAFPDLITRPWTIISYMFLHIDFWHILFNMLWLFWFGKIFLEFMTSRELAVTYLTGGWQVGYFTFLLSMPSPYSGISCH